MCVSADTGAVLSEMCSLFSWEPGPFDQNAPPPVWFLVSFSFVTQTDNCFGETLQSKAFPKTKFVADDCALLWQVVGDQWACFRVVDDHATSLHSKMLSRPNCPLTPKAWSLMLRPFCIAPNVLLHLLQKTENEQKCPGELEKTDNETESVFPWGGLTLPGQHMWQNCWGQSAAAFSTKPTEQHDRDACVLARTRSRSRAVGRMPKFHIDLLQTNVPWLNSTRSKHSKQGELETHMNAHPQNMLVKWGTMKTSNTKPSLLHFLCWNACSLQAGFSNQSYPFMCFPALAGLMWDRIFSVLHAGAINSKPNRTGQNRLVRFSLLNRTMIQTDQWLHVTDSVHPAKKFKWGQRLHCRRKFRCSEIWAHSGEKMSKLRTGHPSNWTFLSGQSWCRKDNLTLATLFPCRCWLTTCWRLQFRCGEIWPHSGEKRPKLRTWHPSNPSFRSELIIVHSWYM